MKTLARLLSAPALMWGTFALAAEPPQVVASFKPVHSLVASVMQGVGEPALLIDSAASPHTYTLRPSNAALLEKAQAVFWIGPDLEMFLEKPLQALAAGARAMALADAPGVEKLPYRTGGPFEAHVHDGEDHDDHDHDEAHHDDDDDHDHDEAHHEDAHDDHDHDHDHAEGEFDMHLWLDPDNARAMTREIVKVLSETDPANATAYQANGTALDEKLAALDEEIAAQLAPVKEKPFIVFHDAYQYMEHHYGLSVAGSITVSPETAPGAARVSEIREKIQSLGATCVFSEPPFEPRLVNTLLEGTAAKSGELNPEGGDLPAGPELYFELMRANARAIVDCLS